MSMYSIKIYDNKLIKYITIDKKTNNFKKKISYPINISHTPISIPIRTNTSTYKWIHIFYLLFSCAEENNKNTVHKIIRLIRRIWIYFFCFQSHLFRVLSWNLFLIRCWLWNLTCLTNFRIVHISTMPFLHQLISHQDNKI